MGEERADRMRRIAAALLILPLFAACGARSTLHVCAERGETRSCENACGVGSQQCVDDQWGACDVAIATRGCSNTCGQGTQTCADGAWSACHVPRAVRTCASPCGHGQEQCTDGSWQPCDAPQPGPPTLTATVRDFKFTHPDFEPDAGDMLDPGIVAPDLGPGDKPTYAGGPFTRSTHGAMSFGEWYNDVPGPPAVNLTTTLSLSFSPSPQDPNIYAYDNDDFFPVDNRLFGNEGKPHNYDFTLELATHFRYTGGETFRFASDDDSWVFVNRKLAVDLGGVHQAMSGSVDLDLESPKLGIVKGGTYPLHVFYAERHAVGAALHIDVAAVDIGVCARTTP